MAATHVRYLLVCPGFLFFFLLGAVCYAQRKPDAVLDMAQPKYTRLSFDQKLNIYEWHYILNYKRRLDDKLSIFLKEDFTSTLQSISSEDLWKDNQNFNLQFDYVLSPVLSAGAGVTSRVLSDQLAGFDNDVVFNSGQARLNYRPNSNVQITPNISRQWQTQLEQSDQGFGYGVITSVGDIDINGYNNDLAIIGDQVVFPDRKNQDLKLNYRVERQFYDATADTLVLVVERLRRDSFDSDAEGVFVRNLVQTNRGIDNRLSYRISDKAKVLLRNAIFSTGFEVRNVKDDTSEIRKDDAGFESRHAISTRVDHSQGFTSFTWSYRFRQRDDNRPRSTIPDPFGRFPTIGFDTEDALVTLSVRNGLGISRADSLGVFASVSKFRFDTTDTTSSNDHDQVKWQITLSHQHRFNESLRLVWRASAFLGHFVFLSSKFSGSNNWDRNFQLTPEIIYQPGPYFSFRQSFTVRAKYQTFDFDDPVTSNRNIVNRQFILSNSTGYSLSNRDRVELGFNLELAEQGRFFFSGFRQRLALSWRSSEIRGQFRHTVGRTWQVAAGINFFQQTRWDHSITSEGKSIRTVNEKHTNVGPLMELLYRPTPSLEVLFFGNVQFSSSSRRSSEQINLFDLNLNWFF